MRHCCYDDYRSLVDNGLRENDGRTLNIINRYGFLRRGADAISHIYFGDSGVLRTFCGTGQAETRRSQGPVIPYAPYRNRAKTTFGRLAFSVCSNRFSWS